MSLKTNKHVLVLSCIRQPIYPVHDNLINYNIAIYVSQVKNHPSLAVVRRCRETFSYVNF